MSTRRCDVKCRTFGGVAAAYCLPHRLTWKEGMRWAGHKAVKKITIAIIIGPDLQPGRYCNSHRFTMEKHYWYIYLLTAFEQTTWGAQTPSLFTKALLNSDKLFSKGRCGFSVRQRKSQRRISDGGSVCRSTTLVQTEIYQLMDGLPRKFCTNIHGARG